MWWKPSSNVQHGDKVFILVPFQATCKQKCTEELNILCKKAFPGCISVAKCYRIEDLLEEKSPAAKENWKPGKDAYVLIDRLVVKEFDEDDIHRMADSVGTAFYEGEGELISS